MRESAPPGGTGRRVVGAVTALLAVAALTLAVAGGTGGSGGTERTTITSDSMAPTLRAGDVVRIDRSATATGVVRGDIVAFDDPGPWGEVGRLLGEDRSGEDHIAKRVVGVGGDVLWCCDAGGRIVLDGVPLDEPYLPPGTPASTRAFRATVPEGHLWLMGDNRAGSVDSRHLPAVRGAAFVPVSAVVGTMDARP